MFIIDHRLNITKFTPVLFDTIRQGCRYVPPICRGHCRESNETETVFCAKMSETLMVRTKAGNLLKQT